MEEYWHGEIRHVLSMISAPTRGYDIIRSFMFCGQLSFWCYFRPYPCHRPRILYDTRYSSNRFTTFSFEVNGLPFHILSSQWLVLLLHSRTFNTFQFCCRKTRITTLCCFQVTIMGFIVALLKTKSDCPSSFKRFVPFLINKIECHRLELPLQSCWFSIAKIYFWRTFDVDVTVYRIIEWLRPSPTSSSLSRLSVQPVVPAHWRNTANLQSGQEATWSSMKICHHETNYIPNW